MSLTCRSDESAYPTTDKLSAYFCLSALQGEDRMQNKLGYLMGVSVLDIEDISLI